MTALSRRWPILSYLLTAHLLFLVLVLGALLVFVAVVVGVVAIFRDVVISGMDAGPGQLLRWFALGYGAWLLYRLLPTCLVHGRTRGEFVRQVPVFQVVASAVLALVIALAYLGETALYRAAGWEQDFQASRLYDSGTDVGLVFVSYWSGLLVWTVAGSMLGAAFYRLEAGGVLLVPVAIALLLVTGLSGGMFEVPFLGTRWSPWDLGAPAVIGISAASAVLAVGLTWALARDLPIRTRVA